ncbi:MAG: putative photosynthetic complex assembly protein PuhE [Pseudomonadota bacterium]
MDTFIPILIALLTWWSSTGILIWVVGQGGATKVTAATTLTLGMIGATLAVVLLRDTTSPIYAYAGFAVGLTVWAWHEAMLLLGYISGPNRRACPPHLLGWARFKASAGAIFYHELGIAAHGGLIIFMSIGAENQVAAATYVLLWGMRLSAKLLIFLGAQNASDRFLPQHLKYLSTYFHTARNSPYFPVFLLATSLVAMALLFLGASELPGSFDGAWYLLLGTLALLAAFEHLALVMPLNEDRLWSWAVKKTVAPGDNDPNDELDLKRT